MNLRKSLRPLQAILLAAVGAGMIMLSACASQKTSKLDSTKLGQPIGPDQLTPAQIGGEVRGFADTYVTLLMHIADQMFDTELTPPNRAILNGLLLHTAYGAYAIASDANPVVSLLDMVVLVTLTRMTAEQNWSKLYDADEVDLVSICRQGEDDIWRLADRVLYPDEQEAMRAGIEDWRDRNPDLRAVSFVRFEDFAGSRRQVHATSQGAKNLFALFALDPMANLDPTTREIERSRLLAERAFYFTKRLPMLFTATAAQVYFEIASTDEATQIRGNLQAFTETAQQFATTVQELPDEVVQRVSTEREAAIKQLDEALTTQRDATISQIQDVIASERDAAIQQVAAALRSEREAFVTSLESEEPRIENLLTELRRTIEAGTQLTETLAVLVPQTPPDAQRTPIELAEVQAVVEQTSLAADRLNVLVQTVDRALAPDDLEARLAQLDLALARVESPPIDRFDISGPRTRIWFRPLQVSMRYLIRG